MVYISMLSDQERWPKYLGFCPWSNIKDNNTK